MLQSLVVVLECQLMCVRNNNDVISDQLSIVYVATLTTAITVLYMYTIMNNPL